MATNIKGLEKGLRKLLEQWREDEKEKFLTTQGKELLAIHTIELEEVMNNSGMDMEGSECPGCGNEPEDGVNIICNHPNGCGFWKRTKSNIGGRLKL